MSGAQRRDTGVYRAGKALGVEIEAPGAATGNMGSGDVVGRINNAIGNTETAPNRVMWIVGRGRAGDSLHGIQCSSTQAPSVATETAPA